MITVEVNKASLSYVEKKLGSLKSKAPKVIAKALNKTAKQARKKLAIKAQEAYTVKTGKFNKNMRIKNATAGSLEAIIRSQGKPLKLMNYRVSAGEEMTRAKVLKSSGLKNLIKGNIKAFVSFGQVAQRQGKSRLPIKVLSSNSIPKMIGSEKRVYGIVKPQIKSDLKKNIDAQIKELVG